MARLRDASDKQILAANVSLQEVQHALAREYGLGRWKALTNLATEGTVLTGHVQEAFEVFTSRGPERDSTGSPWEECRREEW